MALPVILDGKYFEIVAADGNKVRAKCLLCTKLRIIEGFKTPTSNFKTHLKRLHPEILEEYESYKFYKRRKVVTTDFLPDYSNILNIKLEPTTGTPTVTISNTSNNVPKLLQKEKRVGKLQVQDNTLLMDFIVESMSPVEIVEGEKFQKLIKGFHSESTVMCAKALKINLQSKATELRRMISEQLSAVSTICMTVDVCSIGNKSYFASTAHILHEATLTRTSFTLACRRFSGPVTHDGIADIIQELVDLFEIDIDRIHYIITNNGNNRFIPFEKYTSFSNRNGDTEMILPASLESEPEEDEDDIKGSDFWFTDSDILFGSADSSDHKLPPHSKSASHILNLIATIDFDNIPPEKDCHAYMELLRSSMGKCAAIYNKCQRSPEAGEMIKHIFISGEKTGWTGQYTVLEQLLRIKGNLEGVCSLFGLPEFTIEEIEFLKEYLKVISPIATALEMLHVENKFLFGSLAPTILSVQAKLKDLLAKSQLDFLVQAVLNGLSERFSYILELDSKNEKLHKLILASISIPYFKLRWIPQEKLEEFKQVFADEVTKIAEPTNSVEFSTPVKTEEQNHQFFEFPSQSSSTNKGENSANAKIKLECLQYFESDGTELEILHYFPNIKKLFLIHNTPISSSAPVERMLKFSELIKSPERGDTVDDEMFEILRFLQCNGN